MIRTEQINAGRVIGHIAHADRPRGGVLLLPTIMGVDGFSRTRAQILAEAGFTTLVWDPYPGEAPPVDMQSAQARQKNLNDGALDSMSDCVGHLLETLGLPAVAVVGFCLGGRYAVLLAARDRRLFACVPYYPSIRVPMSPNQTLDAVALAAEIHCPVHLIHGTGDQVFVHAVFLQLREALEKRQSATMVQVHPAAVHSFMRPDLQSVPANATATNLSWPPVIAFLQTCLEHRITAVGPVPT